MSLVDAFAKEDRTEVKFSQFFELVKQAAQYETLMNAVNCDVPHRFIRETMTGKKEEVPEKKEAVLGVVKVDFDAEEGKRLNVHRFCPLTVGLTVIGNRFSVFT